MARKKIVTAAAGLMLAAMPVIAVATDAPRVPAPLSQTEQATGDSSLIIALAAAAVVLIGLAVIGGGSDGSDDTPTSP